MTTTKADESTPRPLLSNVLGHLHVINGEANLLVNFPDDPNLKPKERGLKIQEFRLKAHEKVCKALAAHDVLQAENEKLKAAVKRAEADFTILVEVRGDLAEEARAHATLKILRAALGGESNG